MSWLLPISGITNVDDLIGQDIGISEGTIIEYSTNRLLEAEGLSSEDYNTIAVPRISRSPGTARFPANWPVQNMPDPAAALAIQSGATIVIDDSNYPQYGPQRLYVSAKNSLMKTRRLFVVS